MRVIVPSGSRRARLSIVVGLLVVVGAASASAHAPHDVMYVVEASPSFALDQTLLAATVLTDHPFLSRSTDGGRRWSHYGPAVVDDTITDLAFSPAFATDGTVFAGTRLGGVWKSVDGGFEFFKSTNGIGPVWVRQIAVSPAFATDRRVYAATDKGLFHSSDGGASWFPSPFGLPGDQVTAVAFVPGSPQTLLAANKVLRHTSDCGQTWHVQQVFPWSVKTIAVSPTFASTPALAVCFGEKAPGGVEVSVDGGASWSPQTTGLTDLSVNDVAFADDGTMFAVANTKACFRAPWLGAPWTLYAHGFEAQTDQTTVHYSAVVPSPAYSADGQVFVASFEGFFRSTDGGVLWTQGDVYHHRINRQLAFSPTFAQDGLLFVGNYGGGPTVWNDKTGQWTHLATGVTSLWSGALEVSPTFTADQTLYYGYDGAWRSTDGGASWTALSQIDGICRAVELSPMHALDQQVYLSVGNDGVYHSGSAGDRWKKLAPGSSALFNTRALRVAPQFPNDPRVFAASASVGVARSFDLGASWQALTFPIAGVKVRGALAVSPALAADGVLFAGSIGRGLFRSGDGGTSWSVVAGGPLDAEDVIEGIAISPSFATDGTIFVTSKHDGVLKSTDGGASFVLLAGGLPPEAPRGIAVSPAFRIDQTVFTATHEWIYRSQDGGQSWSRLPADIRVDDKYPSVGHAKSWSIVDELAAHGGAYHRSAVTGAEESFEFLGESVSWYARRDGASGVAEVYVDGVLLASVDLYASGPAVPSQIVFAQTFPQTGWHTIRVRVTGQKNAASAGKAVGSDGFRYTY